MINEISNQKPPIIALCISMLSSVIVLFSIILLRTMVERINHNLNYEDQFHLFKLHKIAWVYKRYHILYPKSHIGKIQIVTFTISSIIGFISMLYVKGIL